MTKLWYGTAVVGACSLSIVLTTGLKRLQASTATSQDPQQIAELAVSDVASTHERDLENYQAADALAVQALAAAATAAETADSVVRSQLIQQEKALWQNALEKLSAIPADSALSSRVDEKQNTYQHHLAAAVRQQTALQETFVADVIQDVGVDPASLHITLCQLDADISLEANPEAATQLDGDRCRQYQGAQPLASAASLIKVPIAIALIEKVAADQNIALSDPITLDPNNYTENSAGATLEVAETYSLQTVMSQMIQESDNIGTNQLIDYLGYDFIAQALSDYSQTSIGHKLVGNQAMPVHFGEGINQSTTDDITQMMLQIYSPEGSQAIRTALGQQQDRELGHAALQGIDPAVRWVGEKTGQNDLLLGTTLAMDIGDARYILTVGLDHDGDADAVRQIIRRIASHLLQNGPYSS